MSSYGIPQTDPSGSRYNSGTEIHPKCRYLLIVSVDLEAVGAEIPELRPHLETYGLQIEEQIWALRQVPGLFINQLFVTNYDIQHRDDEQMNNLFQTLDLIAGPNGDKISEWDGILFSAAIAKMTSTRLMYRRFIHSTREYYTSKRMALARIYHSKNDQDYWEVIKKGAGIRLGEKPELKGEPIPEELKPLFEFDFTTLLR